MGSHLLGWRPIGYVDIDDYCQRVIAQRIRDGLLPDAPIFGDIKAFIDSGCAELYRGVTDVITAGFPCQPFSVAGKQLGEDDPRNMWPATIECIRIIRPRYALLENVPGLLAPRWSLRLAALFGTRVIRALLWICQFHPAYCGSVLGDLASAGYDARWTVLGADDVGAHHERKRLWIKATLHDAELHGRVASEVANGS